MKRSKKTNSLAAIFSGVTFLFASVCFAQQSHAPYGNTTQGHVGIGGTVSLDSTSVEGASATTTFRLSTATRYFVADAISVGGAVRLVTGGGTTNLSIGPALEWEFWHQDRLAAYFGQDVLYRMFSRSGNSSSGAELDSSVGLNYFITPSVAFGPAFQYYHAFGTNTFARVDQFALIGTFSIYL